MGRGEQITHKLSIPTPTRNWLLALLLTLLVHLVFFSARFDWVGSDTPKRVAVDTIDQNKIDAIRKKWKSRSQDLVINRDKSVPSEKEPPPDARYMSDRNRRVEREQKARQSNVVPKPKAQAQPKAAPRRGGPALPDLGNLGIPFRLSQKPQAQAAQPRPVRPPSEPGGDQAIRDKTLPNGDQNILNTQESIYYSFYARLYESIGPIWQSRIREIPYRQQLQPGEYSTVVDVVFDKDGNLLSINRIHSSGIPELDQAVDASWRRIGQFPNPPLGLLDKNGEVHTGWTFSVQVGKSSGLMLLPPERNY